jgi:hypothetical protein
MNETKQRGFNRSTIGFAVVVLLATLSGGCSFIVDEGGRTSTDTYAIEIIVPLATAPDARAGVFSDAAVSSIAITATDNVVPYATVATGALTKGPSAWTGKLAIPDGTSATLVFQASARDASDVELYFGDKTAIVSGPASITIPMNSADANNDIPSAQALTPGTTQEAWIDSPSDVDIFSVSLTAGVSYDIRLASIPTGTYVTVNDVIGESLQPVPLVGSTLGSDFSITTITPPSDGVYYLAVLSANGYSYTDSYLVSYAATAIDATMAPGVWKSDAATLSAPDRWYEIAVTAGQPYNVYWDDAAQGSTTYSGNIEVSAYRQDRVTPYFLNAADGYNAQDSAFVAADGDATAYLKVQASWTGSLRIGTYAVKLAEGPPTVPVPTISPSGGSFTAIQTVSLSCADPAAAIRYTTDGSLPSETAGSVYAVPFKIAATATVRAIAYRSGRTASNIAATAYTVQLTGIHIDEGTPTVALVNMPTELIRNGTCVVQAVPSVAADSFAWHLDGASAPNGTGSSFTLGPGLGLGPHTLTVIATSGAMRYSKTAAFTIGLGHESLAFNFENGALPPGFSGVWTVVADATGGSSYTVRSSAIGNNATSSLTYSSPTPFGATSLVLSFKRKVSSETGYDKLSVWINGIKQTSDWSGTLPWTVFSYTISLTGLPTVSVEWRYTKDSSGYAGSDATWIDDITLLYN